MHAKSSFAYEVVLFDFDGLLVDTEPLHYQAYMQMIGERGVFPSWDFARFCLEAHSKEQGVFVALEKEYPEMFGSGITRKVLYERKKEIYEDLLKTSSLSLMQGAEKCLEYVADHQILRAVVTNSPRRQIDWIKEKIPALKSIPLFITREDYKLAKPSPEGYLLAKERLGALHKKGIGFEDTRKGVEALLGAGLDAVWVGPTNGQQLFAEGACVHYWSSLESFSLLL